MKSDVVATIHAELDDAIESSGLTVELASLLKDVLLDLDEDTFLSYDELRDLLSAIRSSSFVADSVTFCYLTSSGKRGIIPAP